MKHMNQIEHVLDKSYLHLDRAHLIEDLEKMTHHTEKALKLGEEYANRLFPNSISDTSFKRFKNIIFLGMGGSAIGGDLISGYLSDEISVPILVIRGYDLPQYIDKNSLIFAVSYSGNTEETLSTLRKSLPLKAHLITLSSGGILQEIAQKSNLPFIKLPSGIQPRAALPYLFFPVLKVLEKMGLINKKDKDIKEMLEIFTKLSREYGSKSPLKDNLAKKIAFSLFRHLPLIYGSNGLLSAVAMRWKTQINENSKWPCFWNVFAELDHNEIVGYEIENKINKIVKIVYLKDEAGHLRINQRSEITKEIIKDKVADYLTCSSTGKEKLSRLFSLIYLGDMVSYYLAILNETDPSPVNCIEILKKELAKIKS